MKRFFLEVLSGSADVRKVEVHSSITLGRSHGNDLAFTGDDAGIVSGRHALVALKSQSLWLRDLDSTNGTFVGKVRVTERELLGGEIISLGPNGPAMRVEVMDVADEGGRDTLLAKARETTSMAAVEMGLLAKPKSKLGGNGNKSLILEMARRLRSTNSPQEVMQGLMRDPERLARLLQGGVMPERVADWVGSVGSRLSSSRKRILWIGGVLGTAAFIALSVLGFQNFSYRSKIKKQGDLISQIHDLEKGLDGFSVNGEEQSPERTKVVHQLLAAERQLFQLREKLKLPDRAPTYRMPLGTDVHQVLEELGKKGFIVPESFIKTVQGQIEYFTKPGNRATLERCFRRKPRFEALIRQELARKNLPADFLYIAMQESLFDSAAQSGNDARGLWQMVPETAKEFDLKVPDEWRTAPAASDERTRPRLATRAAAKYLHLLYSEFGDAALAMAAYNAGAGKMRKTLRRIEDPVNDRDFWYIYRMGMMSPETREYVPKIIAMILIDRNRAKYGFERPAAAKAGAKG
ncbi:MAG: Lytic transglycosylase catalytic [Fibrobacteres bacterium]|nr:Lytic transglycosylase catalytic [Fibrobacterota bacterium]